MTAGIDGEVLVEEKKKGGGPVEVPGEKMQNREELMREREQRTWRRRMMLERNER